jgi:hypothetical protein
MTASTTIVTTRRTVRAGMSGGREVIHPEP